MVTIYDNVLVTRNARDKIQTARFVLEQEGNTYFIRRFTGQFGGKITTQPVKTIEKGKAKRSVLQQAELEYRALVKKATDKGYKKLSDLTKTKFDIINLDELYSIVPTTKTDANGNIKLQSAKSSNDCATSVYNAELFASRKIDGVRSSLKYNKEKDSISSSSRGGGEYDIPTTMIREDDILLDFFRENPDIILDGELYVHGWTLQTISGACRKKEWVESRHAPLEYWIFDIVDPKQNFNERLDVLIDIGIEFEGHDKIKVLEHTLVEGWSSIKRLHDKFVSEGYEGLVLRKPNKKYSPGAKNSDWVKVKDYMDDEFEIVGIEEKLRDEDMVFVMKTKAGQRFNAKPRGNREVKMEYLENWPELVGKMATVTYFSLHEGTPQQPVFKAIRDEGE